MKHALLNMTSLNINTNTYFRAPRLRHTLNKDFWSLPSFDNPLSCLCDNMANDIFMPLYCYQDCFSFLTTT